MTAEELAFETLAKKCRIANFCGSWVLSRPDGWLPGTRHVSKHPTKEAAQQAMLAWVQKHVDDLALKS